MTQLTLTINDNSARTLRRAAKVKAKNLEEYARELLEWYAMKETDVLFQWKPLKRSGKGVKDSAQHHDKYLYGK